MSHLLVAIEQREDRAGHERAQDGLEAQLLGYRREPDQEYHGAPYAYLGGRVLKSDQVQADDAGALGTPDGEEHDNPEQDQPTDEHQRRSDPALA